MKLKSPINLFFLTVTFSLLLIMASACKKNQTRYDPFTVVWRGATDSGGCGFVLVSSTKTFSPNNLPLEFNIDSMEVLVDLRFANGLFVCNNATESLLKVDIVGIKSNL